LTGALCLVPIPNQAAIQHTVSVVSRLDRVASASLAGSLSRRSRNAAFLQPRRPNSSAMIRSALIIPLSHFNSPQVLLIQEIMPVNVVPG